MFKCIHYLFTFQGISGTYWLLQSLASIRLPVIPTIYNSYTLLQYGIHFSHLSTINVPFEILVDFLFI
jgi:uncharacterized membrane protein